MLLRTICGEHLRNMREHRRATGLDGHAGHAADRRPAEDGRHTERQRGEARPSGASRR